MKEVKWDMTVTSRATLAKVEGYLGGLRWTETAVVEGGSSFKVEGTFIRLSLQSQDKGPGNGMLLIFWQPNFKNLRF